MSICVVSVSISGPVGLVNLNLLIHYSVINFKFYILFSFYYYVISDLLLPRYHRLIKHNLQFSSPNPHHILPNNCAIASAATTSSSSLHTKMMGDLSLSLT